MSTNCLVTKLKATVNNSELEKLGVLHNVFFVNSSTNRLVQLDVADGKTSTVKITSPNITVSIANGNCTKVDDKTVIIRPKGNLTYNGFSIAGNTAPLRIETDILNKYNLINLYNSINVDIEKFNAVPIVKLTTNGGTIGSLSTFVKDNPDLLSLTLQNQFADNFITGKFSDLGLLTSIKNISLWSCTSLSNDTVENFVAAQRRIGRTDTSAEADQLKLSFSSTPSITFNGHTIENTAAIAFYWTPTTITVGSETITA